MWPLASGRPSIPPFIWQGSTFSPSPPPLSSSWHPILWFQLISRGGGFIQSMPNGILWYVAPVVAGWEATVYTVFRPITLTSQPTHKGSFELPVFGGIRWAFCSIIAEWIQSQQTDMFTKLCIGGAREITCASLNNWGLIIGWGKSGETVSGAAHLKEWFKEFSDCTYLHDCDLNIKGDRAKPTGGHGTD